MIAAEYKDSDKKVRSDQILQKVLSINSTSTSTLPISSSFSSKQRSHSPITPTSVIMSEDSLFPESQPPPQQQDSETGDGSGRKRKMLVTVVKSATTLAHSEYVQQQQRLSTSSKVISSSETINR